MPDYDVAIIGYGPTGAVAANLLAGRGYRVAVVEKMADIYPKPRAITADHEALRVFQECGLAEEIAAGSEPHPGTDYLGVQGQLIKQFYPLPGQPLAWESSFMFVQPELEATLRKGLRRYPLADTFLETTFARCEQDGGGVTIWLEGNAAALRARYLLACDGGRSAVRAQYGMPIEDLAFDENWIVIDAHMRGDIGLPPRCVQYCRPERPGTYIVGPGALRRWEIKMLPHERPEDFQTEAALRRVLAAFVDDARLEIIRTATYRFHALVARQWRHGRVFLLGDAAHQMPPFMGQGLCAGVRDAVNLAWKLDMVMRHGASDRLLDTYTEERKPHAKAVVACAKAFGLIIGELDARAAAERDRRLGAELASGAAETIRQNFIPGLEHGLIDLDSDGHPRNGAGELFVQPWVRAPGQQAWRRLDDVAGFSFLLALRDERLWTQLPQELRAAWQRIGGQRVAIAPGAALQERDGLFARWMQERGAQAVLVRPDRYVYGTASDGAQLHGLLAALLARLQAQGGQQTHTPLQQPGKEYAN